MSQQFVLTSNVDWGPDITLIVDNMTYNK